MCGLLVMVNVFNCYYISRLCKKRYNVLNRCIIMDMLEDVKLLYFVSISRLNSVKFYRDELIEYQKDS